MELEDTMASLRLNDTLKENPTPTESHPPEKSSPEPLRRPTRFKARVTYSEKRRVYTKPMKISLKDNDTYYLNKRNKVPSQPLETIYEDRDEENCRAVNLSTRIRMRKQRMKVKSVSAQQRVNNKKKVSLKLLLDKLAELDE